MGPWVNVSESWYKWFLEATIAYAKGEAGKSNYRIGIEFAEEFPGINPRSTSERIESKMKEWRMEAIGKLLPTKSVKDVLFVDDYINALHMAKNDNLELSPFFSDSWDHLIFLAMSVKNLLPIHHNRDGLTFSEAENIVNPDPEWSEDWGEKL